MMRKILNILAIIGGFWWAYDLANYAFGGGDAPTRLDAGFMAVFIALIALSWLVQALSGEDE